MRAFLTTALFSFGGLLPPILAATVPPKPKDLINDLVAQTTNSFSWRVEFQLTTFYSISNSIVTKLQEVSGQTNRRTHLLRQLEKITRQESPAERSAIRAGDVLVVGPQIRVENRLLSISAAESQIVSNIVEVIGEGGDYLKSYSYFAVTNIPFPGEAEMRSEGPNTLALPPALARKWAANLVASLTNLSVEDLPTGAGVYYHLKGQGAAGTCTAAYEIDLDPACQLFPRKIVVTQCDSLSTTYILEPVWHERLGWMPIHSELSSRTASGLEVYKESWDFSNYKILPSGYSFANQLPIPVNYVVNEYRFTNSFAYIMGFRAPSKDELYKMAKDKQAILRYQRESRTPGGTSIGVKKALVLVPIALICVLPALLIYINRRLLTTRSAPQR